ncbi:unnamed protein product [Pedinophyceae sp. YPF-701]|nr:unnamed protein product [Pedinophyceae sp. YPF-701]
MDRFTSAAVRFLEAHRSVTNVRFSKLPPPDQHEMASWMTEHSPLQLPPDLTKFYRTCNGCSLAWDAALPGGAVPMGHMHINALRDVKVVPLSVPESPVERASQHGHPPATVYVYGLPEDVAGALGVRAEDAQGEGAARTATTTRVRTALCIDDTSPCGPLALLYLRGADRAPSVWLRDRTGAWAYVAETFTDFFRLSVMHLGLPGWPLALTPWGLDADTRTWLGFLSPERLAINLDGRDHAEDVLQQQEQEQ